MLSIFKRICSFSAGTIILFISAFTFISAVCFTSAAENSQGAGSEGEKLLYSFSFDDEENDSELFSKSGSINIEWVNQPDIGFDDDYALKVTHIEDKPYTSHENAVRLVLPEPLPSGGVYRITFKAYVPFDGNPDKETLTGPGFVVNDDYAGNLGETKFPAQFGTMPVDEWKTVDVTLPLQDNPIEDLFFRFVINDKPNHPDLWYWDDIKIYQVGELVVTPVPEWDLLLPSLYEAFSDYFPFGNILEPNQLKNPEFVAMFKRYYNAVTAGNVMKPDEMSKQKDIYTLENADFIVDWAVENKMFVHGHCLVWHKQSPHWVNMNPDGTPLTRAEAQKNLESFITTIAGHFSGRVDSWDVVNEAFSESGAAGHWHDSLRIDAPWYTAYANGMDESKGEHPSDYIYDAFVYARLAAPDAVLYYLDFNEEHAAKREAMASMTEEFNEKWKTDPRNTEPERFLIEGLGLQAHYWTNQINANDVELTIKRFIETGTILSISELDIPFGTHSTYTSRTQPPTEEELQMQAELYRQLFDVFIRYADNIERLTVWGLSDNLSWRGAGYPVLFDKYYSPKPTFWSVLSVLPDSAESAGTADIPDSVESNPNESADEIDLSDLIKTEAVVPSDIIPEKDTASLGWIVYAAIGAAAAVAVVIALLERRDRKRKG
ncbi:MAG: endo-1,4-beta-xylanase [Oscillospiraceae bacterium]|nr:endo-1,4-beta-xylanase [Oscillospiraceae bacterium]